MAKIEIGKPVVVVTGGTRNIGRAISLKLAHNDYAVAANYLRDDDSAQKTLDVLSTLAPESIIIRADVTTDEGAEYLINKAIDAFGRIDALVNNVGPFMIKDVVQMNPYEWKNIIDSNLSNVFYCSHYVLPHMRKKRNGVIVNIGAPRTSNVNAMGAYGIAKTGVVMLAKYIAKTEGKFGIRSNVVCPGFIHTDSYSDAEIEKWTPSIPLGKFGSVEDIAEAVSFLLSEKAKYISGAVLDVTGGAWL